MKKGHRKNGDKKICIVCKVIQDVSNFWKNKSRYDGLQSACKSCSLIKNNKWKRENKNKLLKIKKRYYLKHKEKIIAKGKDYREKHPDVNKKAVMKWRLKNIKLAKKLIADWEKRNRHRRNHYRHNREYLKRANGGDGFTYEQWQEMIAGEFNYCFYCGDFGVKLTRDHFIPLAKGGKHDISNIVPACQECNSRKSNMMPLEFMNKYGYKI